MGIAFCGVINIYTMVLQIKIKEKYGSHIESYSELGLTVFGPWGKAFVDACIFISQLGFCIAYLLFVGNQIDQVICAESKLEFCQRKNLYIAFGAFILVPICWLKTFKGIAYISFFANISIMFARKFFLTSSACNNELCVRQHGSPSRVAKRCGFLCSESLAFVLRDCCVQLRRQRGYFEPACLDEEPAGLLQNNHEVDCWHHHTFGGVFLRFLHCKQKLTWRLGARRQRTW